MTSFVEALQHGRFVVTTEEPPPKGADVAPFFRRTGCLTGLVDAINLTEASGAVMTMSPAGLVPGLIEQGHTPVLQLTCRDRNRIALQAEVLAAAALGARVIVAMSGDPISGGDDPQAAAVHDLDTPALLRAISRLCEGYDLSGSALRGVPRLYPGAVVNPGAADLDREIASMDRKAEAGARFFQTQAVYDPAAFERFMRRAGHLRLPVLATYVVPKSAEMARRMNRTVPGVRVPDSMIERLSLASDRVECALELSTPVLRELAVAAQGVHLIAVGWEQHFARILGAAAVHRTPT